MEGSVMTTIAGHAALMSFKNMQGTPQPRRLTSVLSNDSAVRTYENHIVALYNQAAASPEVNVVGTGRRADGGNAQVTMEPNSEQPGRLQSLRRTAQRVASLKFKRNPLAERISLLPLPATRDITRKPVYQRKWFKYMACGLCLFMLMAVIVAVACFLLIPGAVGDGRTTQKGTSPKVSTLRGLANSNDLANSTLQTTNTTTGSPTTEENVSTSVLPEEFGLVSTVTDSSDATESNVHHGNNWLHIFSLPGPLRRD